MMGKSSNLTDEVDSLGARAGVVRSLNEDRENGWKRECDNFLNSIELSQALCKHPSDSDEMRRLDRLLKMALGFVHDLSDPTKMKSVTPSYKDNLWNHILLLIKTAYSVQRARSMIRHAETSLDGEKTKGKAPWQGALHAVLGIMFSSEKRRKNKKSSHEATFSDSISFPLTAENEDRLSIALSLVVQYVIHTYPVELYCVEDSSGRLPLHTICASPATKAKQSLLCTVLQAYPEATTVQDSGGIFPLHLACQANYPYEPTLDLLWSTAPYVAELACPCCPPQLLAQHAVSFSTVPMYSPPSLASVSISSSVIPSTESLLSSAPSWTFSDDLTEASERHSINSEAFETIYSAEQAADPYLLACFSPRKPTTRRDEK